MLINPVLTLQKMIFEKIEENWKSILRQAIEDED